MGGKRDRRLPSAMRNMSGLNAGAEEMINLSVGECATDVHVVVAQLLQ